MVSIKTKRSLPSTSKPSKRAKVTTTNASDSDEDGEELNSADELMQAELNAMLAGIGGGGNALRAQLASFEDDETDDEEENEFNQSFEDLEDDEEAEGSFEDMEDDVEDEEENEFNGDDGEDLLAKVDEFSSESDDEEDQDDESPPIQPPPPAAVKKANVRNSKAAIPLKPAELRALAFAEMTASPISNFLSTQVSTLLSPLTPPPSKTSPLQPILKDLHAHLTSLKSQKSISLEGLRKLKHLIPGIVKGSKWDKVEMKWEAPKKEDVRIIGSWAWGGAVKSKKGEYIVEMAIGMPQELLQIKDYLSPRFLAKSTHYLVTLAAHLPTSLGPVILSYVPLGGPQGYALEIRSAYKKGDTEEKIGLGKIKGAVLRLRVVWTGQGSESFLLTKLNPLKNLVRPLNESEIHPPTPIHASALHLSSLPLLMDHLKHFHNVTTTHSAFAPTLRLLQAWSTLRNFNTSLGLTNEFWAWCVARTLDWGANSSQSVGATVGGGEAWAGWRKVVEWLAGVNWTDGMFFRVDGDEAYSKDDFRNAFKGRPIFIDPTGKVNLAAGIDLATLEMLKQDAKTTIALLLSNVSDEQKFEGSFLREIRVVERFDNFARIIIPASALFPPTEPTALSTSLDYATPLNYLVSAISATLQRALGIRAKSFQLIAPSPPSLSIIKSTTPSEPIILTLGIILNATEAGRLVDQGPTAEDEEGCEEFRKFWGPKSELRRFKDGAILESVVWDEVLNPELGQQRNKVVSQIIKYILKNRHGIPETNVNIFAGAMDHLIVEPESVRRAIFLEDSVVNNKGFGNIMTAYDSLVKEINGLENLPLAISSVSPSSAGLRYSTIFTPSPRRLKDFGRFPDSTKFIEVHDIILTMEGSGRWPEDLEGIQKIKSAFLAKIAERLASLHTIFKAEVVYDLDARPIDDNVSLEILTATGFAFRARIHYDRSLLLIQERGKEIDVVDSLAVYDQRFVHAPRHHAALATLQHHFTSYSPTVRLVKRWFSSHLLSAHFPIELIEILVASVFIDSASPYEPPNSGATGFARVMEKLSVWKWKDEAMLVPLYTFSSATTSGRRAAFPPLTKIAAEAAFELRRLNDVNITSRAWCIATEEDVQGIVWGKEISKAVAGRVKGLAKATLVTVENGVKEGKLDVDQLFSPPLGDYAFLIHLIPSAIPRYFQSLSPDSKALALTPRSNAILAGSMIGQRDGEIALLGLDPVATYLQDLERLYPSVFLLFSSADGAATIGGIWNPSAETVRPWSIGLGFPCKPISTQKNGETGKVKVVLDKEAVLKEMERVGKGLVERVELVRE